MVKHVLPQPRLIIILRFKHWFHTLHKLFRSETAHQINRLVPTETHKKFASEVLNQGMDEVQVSLFHNCLTRIAIETCQPVICNFLETLRTATVSQLIHWSHKLKHITLYHIHSVRLGFVRRILHSIEPAIQLLKQVFHKYLRLVLK